MPVCAQVVDQGGVLLLALDPTVTDFSTCPYVVETGMDSLLGSLAAMTPENALVISGAAALFWGTCWGFRMLRDAFLDPQSSSERE